MLLSLPGQLGTDSTTQASICVNESLLMKTQGQALPFPPSPRTDPNKNKDDRHSQGHIYLSPSRFLHRVPRFTTQVHGHAWVGTLRESLTSKSSGCVCVLPVSSARHWLTSQRHTEAEGKGTCHLAPLVWPTLRPEGKLPLLCSVGLEVAPQE